MSAGEEVFAEQGPHAARMGEIASRAGVAVGTLYNYFKDRDALLSGILDRRRCEMIDKLDLCLAEVLGRPFAEQLHEFLRVMLGHFEAHRKVFLLFAQGEQAGMAGVKTPETLREIRQRIAELMQRGLAEGALRPDPGQLYPVFLMGLVRAVTMREYLEQPELSRLPLPVAGMAAPPQGLLGHVKTVAAFFLQGAGATEGASHG